MTETETRVWLDDLRDAPRGWTRCYWPDEVIRLIEGGGVAMVSLDHDLGDDRRGTGYDVLTWMEERAATDPSFTAPLTFIHSWNSVARKRMETVLRRLGQDPTQPMPLARSDLEASKEAAPDAPTEEPPTT